jgi:hypothetical protein
MRQRRSWGLRPGRTLLAPCLTGRLARLWRFGSGTCLRNWSRRISYCLSLYRSLSRDRCRRLRDGRRSDGRLGRFRRDGRRRVLGQSCWRFTTRQRRCRTRDRSVNNRRRLGRWLRIGSGCGSVLRRSCRSLNLGNNLRLPGTRRTRGLRRGRSRRFRSSFRRCLGIRHVCGAVGSLSFRLCSPRTRGASPRRRSNLDCFLNGQEIVLQTDATSSGKHRNALRHTESGDGVMRRPFSPLAHCRRRTDPQACLGRCNATSGAPECACVRVAEGVAISAPGVAFASVASSRREVNTANRYGLKGEFTQLATQRSERLKLVQPVMGIHPAHRPRA